MIKVTEGISLNNDDLTFVFVRSTGPGGQNVNKVSTAVQLRFEVLNSTCLPAEVKSRLIKLAGRKVSQEGVLIIEARRNRTQEKNKADAIARLITLIQKAAVPPRKRYHTKPTRSAREKRLQTKKLHGIAKRNRQTRTHVLE